jgi:mono/diheme cytochrome c family protein
MRGIWFGALALIAACDMQDTETPAARGQQIYLESCADCHGTDGAGGGRLADTVPVPPPDLTALHGSRDGVFPAERVMTQIFGYAGRHQRGLMPEFGPLMSGPRTIWVSPSGARIETPQALIDLAAYLETIQQ